MILIIDNYDSFTYNLYQYVGEIDPDVKVVRNDALTVDEIEAMGPSRIIVSPGPGRPADAGISEELILRMAGKVPILGVCLGHQAICEAFGGRIVHARRLMHGKRSEVEVLEDIPIFAGLPRRFEAARYHSLAADESSLPDAVRVAARAEDGEVMAVEVAGKAVYGVQFHPESVLTPCGKDILRNFIGKEEKE